LGDKHDVHALFRENPDIRDVLKRRIEEAKRKKEGEPKRELRPGGKPRVESPEPAAPVIAPQLSGTDKLVLIGYGLEETVQETADRFGVSYSRINEWRTQVKDKYRVENMAHAYAIAHKYGDIPKKSNGRTLRKPSRSPAAGVIISIEED
jgi:DNA-binding CsgD family transcriptional regulator